MVENLAWVIVTIEFFRAFLALLAWFERDLREEVKSR